MAIIDAALVLGMVGLICYALVRLVMRSQDRRPVASAGRWEVLHYDVKGATRVVLQKVSPTGASVLDEHVVATIPIEDPEYDAKFLTATATARERRALFEAEQDS
jgi:hypothetical protein